MTDLHRVAVPPADDGAVKPWRKLLTGLDDDEPGGRACKGHFLEPGAVYELPTGALIVGCDRTESGHRTRLWRVTRTGDLTVARDSRFVTYRAAFGDSVRRTLRTALAKYPPVQRTAPRLLVAAPDRPNGQEQPCRRCRQSVPAGVGRLVRVEGRTLVEHVPPCPPAPPAVNRYAGSCVHCAGWLSPGEGILVTRPGDTTLGAAHGTDIQACPPPEQRRPAPPRANQRPGPCGRCAQIVPAGEGVYQDGQVGHHGDCPPYPDGHTGATWTIAYGRPAAHTPKPGRGYRIGQTLRATLYEHRHPIPPHTPGYRRLREHAVSAIVTVLAEYEPTYSWDEDGNAPHSDLVGVDGWYFEAVVRPATDAEAAPRLAAEAHAAHRADLEHRRLALFAWKYGKLPDSSRPVQPDLSGAVEVPLRATPGPPWADELYVDEDDGVVWTLVANGADGDDFSVNNVGGGIATVHPLTAPRAELIAALRAEYAAPHLAHRAQVSPEAAQALLDAGWTAKQAADQLGALTLDTATDVTDLLHHQTLLAEAGWLTRAQAHGGRRFTLTDALRLARCGIGHRRAAALAQAGVPIDQMATSTAPTIPDDATRIIIKPASSRGPAVITGKPDTARAWLADRPNHWRPDLIQTDTGIRCVHVEERSSWSLWDDGSLAANTRWIDPAERDQTPRTLHPAAITALNLVTSTTPDSPIRQRDAWHPLRDATAHTATTLDEQSHDDPGSRLWSGKTLRQHHFHTPTGPMTWWEVETYAGGWSGGDADHHETRTVWLDETTARRHFRHP
ncbi:hypothetical protein ACQPYA_03975 [Micromonospora sp. CA-263727]|uniref:hypothetical protein n=1 Tax=Micromonospora sp. CA-263727 TaxID=3239967 RepID=UPI003D8C3903